MGGMTDWVRRLLSFQTPRSPLRWSVLAALILFTLTVLRVMWAIAEARWIQWIVITASLLFWDFLVVRAGERQPNVRPSKQAFALTAITLFLSTVALLILATVLTAAYQDSALFPGRKAIHYMVISVPLMIWANLYLRDGTE
jgi:hypothetical protein